MKKIVRCVCGCVCVVLACARAFFLQQRSLQSVAVSPGEVVRRKEGVAQRGRQQSGGREERRPKKKVKGRAGGEEASRGKIKGGSSGGETAYCIPRDQVKSEGWQSSEEEKQTNKNKR